METHHCAEDYESDEETEEEHPNEDDGRSPDYQSHDYGVSYVWQRIVGSCKQLNTENEFGAPTK